MSLARNNGFSGALFEISGAVPTNATWQEDIYFSDNGSPKDISGLDWKMVFRCAEGNNIADFTISTDDGTLSIVTDPDSGVNRILRINVAAGNLNVYNGEFIADLASRDDSGVVTLWGHGVVTFVYNPTVF